MPTSHDKTRARLLDTARDRAGLLQTGCESGARPAAHLLGDVAVHADEERDVARGIADGAGVQQLDLGSGRIVASQTEAPNLFVNLV